MGVRVPVGGSTGFHRKSEIVLCELRQQDRRQEDVGEDLVEDESDYFSKEEGNDWQGGGKSDDVDLT